MMLLRASSFWTISDGFVDGFRSKLNLELVPADVGVALEAAGERLPVVPAVEGVDTLPIPLLTEPATPPPTAGPLPCSRSHLANKALTRSSIESEVGSPQESFESDVEEVSSVFLLPADEAEAVLPILASAASSDSITVVAAAAAFGAVPGGFLTEEATCSSPSRGSWGRSEALALMAIMGGAYFSPECEFPWRSPPPTAPPAGLLRGGDLRQPGVVGDLRRGSALGRCREGGFAEEVFGEGVAAVDKEEAAGAGVVAAPAEP